MHAYIDGANVELKKVVTDANERIHQINDAANATPSRSKGGLAAISVARPGF